MVSLLMSFEALWRRFPDTFRLFARRFKQDPFFALVIVFTGLLPAYFGFKRLLRRLWAARRAEKRRRLLEEEGLDISDRRVLSDKLIEEEREAARRRREDEELAEKNSRRNVAVVWVDSRSHRASDRLLRRIRAEFSSAKVFSPPDLEGDVDESHYFIVSFAPERYSWRAFEEQVIQERIGTVVEELRSAGQHLHESVRMERGNLEALRTRQLLMDGSFRLDKDEFGARLLSNRGAAADEDDVMGYWLGDPSGVFEATAGLDAPDVIDIIARGTPVSFVPQVQDLEAVEVFPTGVVFGPKGDLGIVILWDANEAKDEGDLEHVLQVARALSAAARVLVLQHAGDASLREAALGALAWLAAGEPQNGLTRGGHREQAARESGSAGQQSQITTNETDGLSAEGESKSVGCRNEEDEFKEDGSTGVGSTGIGSTGVRSTGDGSTEERSESDEGDANEESGIDDFRVGDGVCVQGCLARVEEYRQLDGDASTVEVKVVSRLYPESFDQPERSTFASHEACPFVPKRTGLVAFGGTANVAVQIAVDSEGAVNDAFLNGLCVVSCVGGSPRAKSLSSLRTPIQLHLDDDRCKARFARCLKRATAYQLQQVLLPSTNAWENAWRWMFPPVRMEDGRYDDGFQDVIAPELVKAEVPLRFEVHALHQERLVRQMQRFLYDELDAGPSTEPPDEEKIKLKKYASIIPIVKRFSRRMAPAQMVLFGQPERPGLLDSPLSFIVAGSAVSIACNAIEVLLAREHLWLMRLACEERLDMKELTRTAGLSIVLVGVTEVMENLQRWLIRSGSKRFVLTLKADVFAKLLQCEVPYVDRHSADSLLRILEDDTDAVSDFFTYKFPDVVDSMGYFFGGLATMLNYSPELLTYAILQGFLSQELYRLGHGLVDYLRDLTNVSENSFTADISGETMRNFKTVRLYNRQEYSLEMYRKYLFENKGSFLRSVSKYVYPAIWFLRSVMRTVGVVYAGRLVSRGLLEEVYLQTALSMSHSFSWRMLWFVEQFFQGEDENGNNWMAGGARMLVLLERKPSIELFEGIRDVELRGEIEFKNVWFSYSEALEPGSRKKREDGEMVIRDLSLHIPAGSKIGLVGKSGSGKSTMLNLLQRFYDPAEGSILLDGRPLTAYAPSFLSSVVSVVTQEAVVFNASIRQNVVWGATGATDEQVEAALRAAQLWHDVECLPRRLDTNAQSLSGGQKQRLTIARAIVKQPKLLLLDEATAALDTKSEKGVQTALNELMRGKTCVAIAHRLSTLVDSDKICVVQRGSIVEEGSHTELQLREGGVYRELSRLAGMSAGDAEGLLKARNAAQLALNCHPEDSTLQNVMKHLEDAANYQAAETNRLKELQRTYERVLAVHERDGDAIAMQVELQQALQARKLRDLNNLATVVVVCARKRSKNRRKATALEDVEQFVTNELDEEGELPHPGGFPELHRHETC